MQRYQKKAQSYTPKAEVLMIFCQQFCAMLRAGLSVLEALRTLEGQSQDRVFKVILDQVCQSVSNGLPLSAALARFPKAFPVLLVSLVEAGEVSGHLADMMDKAALYLKASLYLTKKVKSALVYPLVVLTMAALLIVVMMVWVIPVFSDMFANFGAELPVPTQLLIDASHFMGKYFWALIALGVAAVGGLRAFLKTQRGKAYQDRLVHRLPLAGDLSNKVAIARFCRTYAILFRSGVALLRAIQICSNASDNTFIQGACVRIAAAVHEGKQISGAIAQDAYFPMIMVSMLQAGEKTSNIDGMLNSVAEFFESEVDNTVSTLTTLIEPFMIAFLGIVVGGIVLAMFLPIFQLSSVVGR
jgi:type IV pilus assembly protein PilC